MDGPRDHRRSATIRRLLLRIHHGRCRGVRCCDQRRRAVTAPSAATLHAVHRLTLYDPRSTSEALKIALRLWPKPDPNNLDTIVALWAAQRRPKTAEPSPVVIVSKIT